MADYRNLAAALGAGYGQDTGPITADTLQTLKSGYRSPNFLGMLADIGRGSLSNLESLVRGGVAQVPGTAGDIEALARMGLNKSFGAGGVNVNQETALPTTADIMKMLPQRMTQARPETVGMEELGTVMGPGLGKAVKPLAKAYANLALEDIAMASTGQPTRSLLGDITPKPLMLDVYHGTPHTLPPTERNPLGEFDASKIGTGEGAQAYGHGIYTAENPAVAKEYQFMEQNWFDTSKAKYKGKSIDTWYEQAQKDQERAFRTNNKALEKDATARLAYWENIMTHNHPENVLKQFTDPEYGWDAATNYAKSIDLGKFEGIPRTGNLYKVDLPDEKIATMLDWDKPLSQQSAQVKEALKGIEQNLPSILDFDLKKWMDADPLASTWHNVLARDLKVEPSKIAELLQNKGIAGIKYLDEGSRATTGKKTSNFVVFPNEEKNMTILERNAEKITK
jgi:hypothetical protein